MKKSLLERFLGKVDTISPRSCWRWMGNKRPDGYGRIQADNVSYRAHRIAFELFIGPVPDDKFVCHACDNPSCVNPGHLFVGTHEENMRDMHKKRRGNKPAGSAHYKSKLTEQDVKEIRSSDKSSRQLAKAYGISHHSILCIKRRETWQHIG